MMSARQEYLRIHRAAKMAAEWWGDRLQQGDRAAFVATLRDLVARDLEAGGECRLECDYDPDGHLLEAVRAAGVECRGFLFSAKGILPQKHLLDVRVDRMRPKEGYGNWTEGIVVPETARSTKE